MSRSRMQGDNSTPPTRTSSLAVQLQQAWLHTQLPKVAKPLPLAKSFSSSRSTTSSFSSRFSGKKPENLSNISAIRTTTSLGSGSSKDGSGSSKDGSGSSSGGSAHSSGSDDGSGWTPSSTLSLDSAGSAGFSDWSSPGLVENGVGDPWDFVSSPSPINTDTHKKKVSRIMFSSSNSYSFGMAQESLAYHAVHQDLEEVIGGFDSQAVVKDDDGPRASSPPILDPQGIKRQHSEDVENWIDSLLNGPPPTVQPAELRDELSSSSKLDSADASSLHSALERQLPPQQMPDLNELLVRCAESVAVDDVVVANSLVGEIRQYSSPFGNGIQRLAHYFTEGLVARLSGSGADLYTALSNKPTDAEMVKAYHMLQLKCPYFSLGHMFSNTSLLKVFEGASRVHIVDYGILYGFQWPDFIKDLAGRPGGPPRLRITGIDFPRPGFKPAARLDETGMKLSEVAKLWGVPFEFQAVASKWENVHPAALGLRHDEVLAVSCLYRLRHLLDESVMPSSPRKVVLNRIRSMNPKIFITAVISATYNVPFFLSRFRESLYFYAYAFDALDSIVPRDCEVRMNLEREILGREILNVVACEGTERVERPEVYPSWQRRLQNAGFKMLPLEDTMIEASQEKMKTHHKDFGIGDDKGWLLLGWKGQVVKGLAAWEPAA